MECLDIGDDSGKKLLAFFAHYCIVREAREMRTSILGLAKQLRYNRHRYGEGECCGPLLLLSLSDLPAVAGRLACIVNPNPYFVYSGRVHRVNEVRADLLDHR